MPNYKYTAKDMDSNTVTGQMEAASVAGLYSALKSQSLVLLESREIGEAWGTFTYKLKLSEVAEFSRQSADMIGAGLTILRAIDILSKRDLKPQLKELYDRVHANIQNGQTLSESLRQCGKAFPEFFINMCAAGEASGQLEKTLRKMAEYYDKEHKLSARIKSALTYPIILVVMTVAVVLLVFTVILPSFFELFEGMELPLITQAMLSISNFIINYWYILIFVFVFLVVLVRGLLSVEKVRIGWDRGKLENPFTGKQQKIICTARFARGLSSLYSSGLPLINALTIAATLVQNKYIEAQFPAAIQDVRNGRSLSGAIEGIHGFDTKLAATIYVGEESGRLVSMLESVADSYDFEAEMASERMVKMIEPIMIIIMAAIIGTIMLSVMLPIMSLYQNAMAM